MAKASRDKGARRERQVVKMAHAVGMEAYRVPLSGSCRGFKDDVLIHTPNGKVQAEVKARKHGGGFKTIENWLGDSGALVLWQDRREPIVCMRWSEWIKAIGAGRTTREMDEVS